MMVKTPDCYFLVKGSAEGHTPLNSFDNAILNAGIGNTNLVKMSSILPPSAEEINPVKLPYGALIPIAYAAITNWEVGSMISAAVAVGIPENPELPGLIMEYSSREPQEIVEKKVREMVSQGFVFRGFKLKEIKSISVHHIVEKTATAFAGVVLWYKDNLTE